MTRLDPHIIAAFFSAGREADPEPEAEPEAGPVPYTLTPRAEAVLASWDQFRARGEPEPEAEPEWDWEDSNAYQARVEAGLEPEAEL